jgi:Uma2 family endonuclease
MTADVRRIAGEEGRDDDWDQPHASQRDERKRRMSSSSPIVPGKPEPAWDIARLFPPQGHWTEGNYLSFTESLNQLVELVDGRVEVLEMPTKSHQKIVQYLLHLLLAFLTARRLGDAISAPYRVRLRGQTYREPDIVVYLSQHADRFGERYGEGADLVMEVVSGDAASRARDYEDKRRDYAEGGIPEYWIIDPVEQRIAVLSLAADAYRLSGEFQAGEEAESELLPGFRVSVTEALQAGKS